MLKLELSLDHVNFILRVLDEQPFGIVSPIINTIREQCVPQLEIPVEPSTSPSGEPVNV